MPRSFELHFRIVQEVNRRIIARFDLAGLYEHTVSIDAVKIPFALDTERSTTSGLDSQPIRLRNTRTTHRSFPAAHQAQDPPRWIHPVCRISWRQRIGPCLVFQDYRHPLVSDTVLRHRCVERMLEQKGTGFPTEGRSAPSYCVLYMPSRCLNAQVNPTVRPS